MNSENMNHLKGLMASAIYFDELNRTHISGPRASRKTPKSKKTLANRSKNKQARQSRKKNR